MTTDEKGVLIQIQNTSVSSKTLVLVNCLNAFVHGCTESKAVISPPKRIKKTYTFPQALSYASQHTFLMFRIILLVSVFIHLPIKSQHYNIAQGNKDLFHALIGTRTRTLHVPIVQTMDSAIRRINH